MKVIIAGSRNITDQDQVDEIIWGSPYKITEGVSGNARGVDTLGANWCIEQEIPVAHFPADWATHGKYAGYLRNEQMAKYADALIAVWDGESKGTKHMIDTMTKLNKPVYVYRA